MPEAYLVKPDGDFLGRVLDEGGEDLKKCFQCATCSVVCELSDGKKPFPRKEMIWAQWGLKDKLVADPDIWLCHQCNDCSTKCPRGARPGDVLAAIRHETIQHYAVPQAFARCVNQVKYLPFMLLLPVVLLVLALLARDPIWASAQGVLKYAHHEGFYAALFPHWLLIGFYTTFWSLAMLGAAVGVMRFWKAMKAADVADGTYTPAVGIIPSFIRTLTPIFTHGKFGKCTSQASRKTAHLGAFYGFAALFLVSVWAVIALYMINPFMGHDNHLPYPFPLLDFSWPGISGVPWKLLANAGAIALIAGCLIAINDRCKKEEGSSASTSFDWIFVYLLLAVGITGFVTQVLRWIVAPETHFDPETFQMTALAYTAYAIYFVHLVVVFHLLVYLPYSKFAHIVYRTVALVYAEHSGRNAQEVTTET
jgi:quinone-modifying oxidoreductase subunit QmoC